MTAFGHPTFLQAWFYHMSRSQYIEITFIHDSDKSQRPHSLFITYDEINTLSAHIEDYQRRGFGAFFGVTPSTVNKAHGRRKQNEVSQLLGMWLDMDNPPDNLRAKLTQLRPAPNMVVYSGGGFHAYWRFNAAHNITDANRDITKKTLKDFAAAYTKPLGADVQCVDLPRVLRIPNTWNLKPKYEQPRPVQLVSTPTTDCVDFATMYRLFYKQPQARPRYETGANDTNDAITPVVKYLQSGANEGNRNAYLFYAANRMKDAGKSQAQAEQVLSSRASADGLTHDEIIRTIASAYRS